MSDAGLARRKFLKHAGMAAWASPVIITMLSRSAQAQVVVCGSTTNGLDCLDATACSPPNTLCAPAQVGPGNCTCQPD
jgi:hypothetical protein